LFELLCFAGELDRAEKHLAILADTSKDSQFGATLYFSTLKAERARRERFAMDVPMTPPEQQFAGTINEQEFSSIVDADPRIGAQLELFADGEYLLIPFDQIISIEIPPPRRLRHLLWTPALVRTAPDSKDRALGEVFIPALCPGSYRHTSEAVRLGRETHWELLDNGDQAPIGQKMFLVDDEEFPLLEIRKLEFAASSAAAGNSTTAAPDLI
jgi:type VI secretion system protein ImpE